MQPFNTISTHKSEDKQEVLG